MNEDLHFQYYAIAFIDILGQRDAFAGFDRLPETELEKNKLIEALKSTIGFIKHYREGFETFFNSFAEPSKLIGQLPADKQALFKEIRTANVEYFGFSDFFVPFVSLRTDNHACSAINGIFQLLAASGSMFLISLVAHHSIRGGIEVGTGIRLGKNEIYGPVLNHAYALESARAQYPRLLIGTRMLEYLRAHEGQEGSSVYVRHCKMVARLCLDMTSVDADGLPILDYLGEGFRRVFTTASKTGDSKGAETFDEAVPKAFAFIQSEHDRFAAEGNTKLALRYQLLMGYFASRAVTPSI